MKVTPTPLPGVLLIEPRVFEDARGFFLETYHRDRYAAEGMRSDFIQDNHGRSLKGVLRGLHFQLLNPQVKLVRVIHGEVFDVAVDIRRGSPTFGKWFGTILSEDNKHQLYIPEGFAHGYCVLSEIADFEYKATDFYWPDDQKGVIWCDPELAISWPIKDPILSENDMRLRPLSEVELPLYINNQ